MSEFSRGLQESSQDFGEHSSLSVCSNSAASLYSAFPSITSPARAGAPDRHRTQPSQPLDVTACHVGRHLGDLCARSLSTERIHEDASKGLSPSSLVANHRALSSWCE